MRFTTYEIDGVEGVGLRDGDHYRGRSTLDLGADLQELIARGPAALTAAGERLAKAPLLDMEKFHLMPVLPRPGSLICIGLNYADHSAESGFELPKYPTVFGRFANSLVAHGAPIVRPMASVQLDYEGELAVVIGMGGRHIQSTNALEHVAGYSVFNDASIRDYQFKSPQWTMGKTFDGTGAFGPEFVTADELPAGAKGLKLQTRLNGETVQSANTNDLVFGVRELISILSEVITLRPGDVIVSGTPSGVGLARKPPLWMVPGDICEVEIEGVGLLSNPIVQESSGLTGLKEESHG